jgi:hypothetical protein
MFKEQLEVWMKDHDKPYSISGNELKTKCLNPEHTDRNPSFSINVVTGSCYCFSCGFRSHANRILDLKQDDETIRLSKYLQLNRLWDDQEDSDEPPIDITLPPVDFLITESIRGIPKEILMELGVYYCSHGRYKGRLILPVRDTRGNLLGFDARIYEHPDRPDVVAEVPQAKYLRPSAFKTINVLYPLDYLYNHKELDLTNVAITEGVFDALSYLALGIPAVCNFGLSAPTATKAGYLLSLGVEAVSSAMDHDAAGIEGWQKIKEVWRSFIPLAKPLELTKQIWASGKDANKYLEELKHA